MNKELNTPTHTWIAEGNPPLLRWRRLNRTRTKCSNAFKRVIEAHRATHDANK